MNIKKTIIAFSFSLFCMNANASIVSEKLQSEKICISLAEYSKAVYDLKENGEPKFSVLKQINELQQERKETPELHFDILRNTIELIYSRQWDNSLHASGFVFDNCINAFKKSGAL